MGPLIGPLLCRDTPVSRTANVSFFQVVVAWNIPDSIVNKTVCFRCVKRHAYELPIYFFPLKINHKEVSNAYTHVKALYI